MEYHSCRIEDEVACMVEEECTYLSLWCCHSSSVIITHWRHSRGKLINLRIHLRITSSHIWFRHHVLPGNRIDNNWGSTCDNQLVSSFMAIIIFLLRSDVIISMSLYPFQKYYLGLCLSQFCKSTTATGYQNREENEKWKEWKEYNHSDSPRWKLVGFVGFTWSISIPDWLTAITTWTTRIQGA